MQKDQGGVETGSKDLSSDEHLGTSVGRGDKMVEKLHQIQPLSSKSIGDSTCT